mgnify:CR=1 FL=1
MSDHAYTISEIRPVAGQSVSLACDHAAQRCPSEVARQRWPRFVGACSARGQACTLYASIQHCEAGG